MVRDGLASLNRHKIPDDQRFKLLELYRAKIQQLLPAVEEAFSQTPLPLPEPMRQAANLARDLLNELAYGYKILILEHTARFISFGSNRQLPLILERALTALNRILVNCYQAYAPTPAGIWSEIHQLYRYAVQEGIQDTTTDDEQAPGLSVNLVYKQGLLLALADPYRLMQGEAARTLDYLSRFGQQAHLMPLGQTAAAAGFFLIRLESDKPPRAVTQQAGSSDPRSDILLNTMDLARLLHHHITRLESGDTPASLGLPDAAREPAYLDLLRRLIRHWGIAPKRHFTRLKSEAGVEICSGLRAIYHFMTGQPASLDHGAAEAAITVQFSSSPIDQSSQQTFQSAHWAVTNESPGGFSLTRQARDGVPVRVGEVIGLRADKSAAWNVGAIRWIQSDAPAQMRIGVQMLAPNAEPIILIPEPFDGEQGIPALLLPELPILKQPATLLTAPGTYRHLREFRTGTAGDYRTLRATKLLEQTVGYELFQFA